MPLLQLPTEILLQIFAELGDSYFRSDLSRLTICKQWSVFARCEISREIYATHERVRQLLSTNTETAVSFVKDNVETLDLCLKSFKYWDPTPLYQQLQASGTEDILDMLTWTPQYYGGWRGVRTRDLFQLGTIIRQSHKLRTLRIYTFNKLPPKPIEMFRYGDRLSTATVCLLLSAHTLTSLELDLWRSWLDRPRDGPHICLAISALLPTLRRLRVRMQWVCPKLLQVQDDSVKNLCLSDVVVNLGLPNPPAHPPRWRDEVHSTTCGYNLMSGYAAEQCASLTGAMEQQAQALVAQMAAPKRVWILTRAIEGPNLEAFDALAGETMALEANNLDLPPWGDEGAGFTGWLDFDWSREEDY